MVQRNAAQDRWIMGHGRTPPIPVSEMCCSIHTSNYRQFIPNQRPKRRITDAMRIPIEKGDALIIVDVQNDFVPGGALGVPQGDHVVHPLNKEIQLFRNGNNPVFLTRDWHPANHSSFQEQGGPWPPHCVQDTPGAAFVSGLTIPDGAIIITKGVKIEPDQYSGFQGVDADGNSLDERLKKMNISRIFIGGLATDYCVLNTVLDGLKYGYDTYVLTDAIRPVNVQPDDGKKALEEMTRCGAHLTTTESLGV
jgi:nicotinamidase/pyrazinamidase